MYIYRKNYIFYTWINILSTLLNEYNFKIYHRSIGMRPCDVNKSNEENVLCKTFPIKKTK